MLVYAYLEGQAVVVLGLPKRLKKTQKHLTETMVGHSGVVPS